MWKVRVRENLDFESQVDRTISNKLEEKIEWNDSIILQEKFSDEESKLADILPSFDEMWNGTLGSIKATQEYI